ncbi:recombinase family protein [Paracraurococcus ruber]|uniref:recombinase family protein n=1 Tax=Paracraurococcus ruber TaxID=77675 RepID=UPI00130548A3|nr:recombinase family protein [Paracraurococcus ruber]
MIWQTHLNEAAMAVFGYVRVSTAEQASDDRSSLETQRRKISAAAEMASIEVTEFIEELGISGSLPLALRPAGGPLLTRMRAGDRLIVAKLDRAFRNADDALATSRQLQARGIDLVIVDMGSDPVTQNGVSRLFFGMLALVAEFERERIRERVTEGKAAKRRAGGHIGGAVPFGFRKVGTGRAARLEADEMQQAALADAYIMSNKRQSSRAISTALQERHGLTVSHVTVRAALVRERNLQHEAANRYREVFGHIPEGVRSNQLQPALTRKLLEAVERRRRLTPAEIDAACRSLMEVAGE